MDSVCRLCLSTNSVIDIFQESLRDSFYEMIFTATGVVVQVTDHVSKKICTKCYKIVLYVHRFREYAVTVNELLHAKYDSMITLAANEEERTRKPLCGELSKDAAALAVPEAAAATAAPTTDCFILPEIVSVEGNVGDSNNNEETRVEDGTNEMSLPGALSAGSNYESACTDRQIRILKIESLATNVSLTPNDGTTGDSNGNRYKRSIDQLTDNLARVARRKRWKATKQPLITSCSPRAPLDKTYLMRQCHLCPYIINSCSDRVKHLATHRRCNGCELMFSNMREMHEHVVKCPRTFSTAIRLVRIDEDEELIGKYECLKSTAARLEDEKESSSDTSSDTASDCFSDRWSKSSSNSSKAGRNVNETAGDGVSVRAQTKMNEPQRNDSTAMTEANDVTNTRPSANVRRSPILITVEELLHWRMAEKGATGRDNGVDIGTTNERESVIKEPDAIVQEPIVIDGESSEIDCEPSVSVNQQSTIDSESSATDCEPSAIAHEPSVIVDGSSAIVSESSPVDGEPSPVVAEPSEIVAESREIVAESREIVTEPREIVAEPNAIVAEPREIVAEPNAIVAESSPIVTEPSAIVAEPSATRVDELIDDAFNATTIPSCGRKTVAPIRIKLKKDGYVSVVPIDATAETDVDAAKLDESNESEDVVMIDDNYDVIVIDDDAADCEPEQQQQQSPVRDESRTVESVPTTTSATVVEQANTVEPPNETSPLAVRHQEEIPATTSGKSKSPSVANAVGPMEPGHKKPRSAYPSVAIIRPRISLINEKGTLFEPHASLTASDEAKALHDIFGQRMKLCGKRYQDIIVRGFTHRLDKRRVYIKMRCGQKPRGVLIKRPRKRTDTTSTDANALTSATGTVAPSSASTVPYKGYAPVAASKQTNSAAPPIIINSLLTRPRHAQTLNVIVPVLSELSNALVQPIEASASIERTLPTDASVPLTTGFAYPIVLSNSSNVPPARTTSSQPVGVIAKARRKLAVILSSNDSTDLRTDATSTSRVVATNDSVTNVLPLTVAGGDRVQASKGPPTAIAIPSTSRQSSFGGGKLRVKNIWEINNDIQRI